MTLQSSDSISMSDVNVQLGYASTQSLTLNDTNARTLAGIPSGAISMSDFYGKPSVLSNVWELKAPKYGSE
jgi:hypothetical protein